MASPTQWTWVWANSGRGWRTGKPGMLKFMGSQRVRHNWAIELNWTEDEPGKRFSRTPSWPNFSLGLQVHQQSSDLDKLCISQFSCSITSDSRLHGMPHARHPCPSPTPRAWSNSCPLSYWCHPTIFFVIAFSSCLQSFPASGSF